MSTTIKHFDASTEADDMKILELIREKRKAGLRPMVSVEYGKRHRTPKQNNSIHKFFDLMAQGFNDAGLDKRVVFAAMREGVEIPWDGTSFKKDIWKPIQGAVLGFDKTSDANTTDYTPVYEALARWCAERFGYRIPDWPSRDSQLNESLGRKAA